MVRLRQVLTGGRVSRRARRSRAAPRFRADGLRFRTRMTVSPQAPPGQASIARSAAFTPLRWPEIRARLVVPRLRDFTR